MYYSTNGLNWTVFPSSLNNIFAPTSTTEYPTGDRIYPVPGSNRWVCKLNYFTLSTTTVGAYTFNSGVQSIEQYIQALGAATGKISTDPFWNSYTVKSTRSSNLVVIPISATSFYVKMNAFNRWSQPGTNPDTTLTLNDDLGTVYGTYTISGNTITASSFTRTYTAPPAEPAGSVTTLASGVTRTTNYDVPIAYATVYHYPGVSGTPAIYRVGYYGIGSNNLSVEYGVATSTVSYTVRFST
jgi:hypothetical protein